MAFQHKKESGLIEVKGNCTECNESWEGGGVALQATRHFHNTGHRVYVQQTIFWTWEPILDTKGNPIAKKATKKKKRKK